MSVIGLDFGSHTSSIALWYEEKGLVEVIADDLGSRTIPNFVGFRSDEVIVGQTAMSQYHKNANNTFEDIRNLILDPAVTEVNVPVLEKSISVQELASHYFRNIHNQIKQQVGRPVRECVLSIPHKLDDAIKQRLFESAQAGGIRIKSIIDDSSSTLIAYGFDDASIVASKVAIVDMGWSTTEISIYAVSGGLFFPLSNVTTTQMSGKVLVNLLAEHCAKDFQRKSKVSCTDNKKSMLRLRRECEEAMKHLSTGQEATIDIDSLFEGVDYSGKISRARFEDLGTIPFVHLKTAITEAVNNAKLTVDAITDVCLSGGLSAVPKAFSTVKGIFTTANFPRGKFESYEAQCLGAALHGRSLLQLGLLESPPSNSPTVSVLSRPVLLSSGTKESAVILFPTNTALPITRNVTAHVGQAKGFFQLLVGAETNTEVIGEVVFDVASAPVDVNISITVEANSAFNVVVVQTDNKATLATLVIPAL